MNDIVRRTLVEFLAGPAHKRQEQAAVSKLQERHVGALVQLAEL